MTNVGTNNECEVIDGKYEYVKTLLTESKSKYISIPLSVIIDTELDAKRVGILSYLRIHCGLNDVIGFTIPDMVEWCGGKPDRRANGSNDKFLNIVDAINDMGYLTYLNERSRSSYMKCKLDMNYFYKECLDGYAIIYLDELEKIVRYNKEDSITNTTMLLVFAYLRNKIKRRPNELKPEERSSDGIKARRERMPEAYNANIIDIADDLGISKKPLLKVIDVLEQDLKLIVTDRAFRTKNSDGEYRTPPMIFANAYKREDKYLLAAGEDYSRTEIELKVKNIQKYYKNYEIDERKRKAK